tara:strand:- start:762 stop:1634 length:873 start_codon:yes stop_codon:yes gene_type:complete
MAKLAKSCRHCGRSYHSHAAQDTGFCCDGCERVYGLIQKNGLASFYDLQDRVGVPVANDKLDHAALKWLVPYQAELEASFTESALPGAVFSVSGMTCPACSWLVQRLAQSFTDLKGVSVDLHTARLSLEWIEGSRQLYAYCEQLHQYGYRIKPARAGTQPAGSGFWGRHLLILCLLGNGFFGALPLAEEIGRQFSENLLFLFRSLNLMLLCILLGGSRLAAIFAAGQIVKTKAHFLWFLTWTLICTAALVALWLQQTYPYALMLYYLALLVYILYTIYRERPWSQISSRS